jgi:hypothetical protein
MEEGVLLARGMLHAVDASNQAHELGCVIVCALGLAHVNFFLEVGIYNAVPMSAE